MLLARRCVTRPAVCSAPECAYCPHAYQSCGTPLRQQVTTWLCCLTLCVILPPFLQVTTLAALLSDLPTLATRLLALRAALPEANVSALVARAPWLALDYQPSQASRRLGLFTLWLVVVLICLIVQRCCASLLHTRPFLRSQITCSYLSRR